MRKCDSCKYPYDIRKWPCEDCLQGDRWEQKSPTNADIIRAMTDEELANCIENEILTAKWCDPDVEVDPVTLACAKWDCCKCILEWLQQKPDNV